MHALTSMREAQRFYFHFSDLSRNVLERDWKGRPCETDKEARAYAQALANGLATNTTLLGSTLIVSDERGRKLETITV